MIPLFDINVEQAFRWRVRLAPELVELFGDSRLYQIVKENFAEIT